MKKLLALMFLLNAASAPLVFAAVPSGALKLGAHQVFVTSNDYGSFTCGFVRDLWVAGSLVGPQDTYFLSYDREIQNNRSALKLSTISRKKKILAKIKKLLALRNDAEGACDSGPSFGTTPTATPTSGVTPKPTSTPVATSNFDSQGNVTAKGKTEFGIPLNLDGNVSSGKNIHNTYCIGCHGERTGYSFAELRALIAQSPMSFDTSLMPDASLAQITAYLNRYSL